MCIYSTWNSIIPGIGEIVIPILGIAFICTIGSFIGLVVLTACVIIANVSWLIFLLIEVIINFIGWLFALIPGCGFVTFCTLSSFAIGSIIWACLDIIIITIMIILSTFIILFGGVFAIPFIICGVFGVEGALMVVCAPMTAIFLVWLPFLILCAPVLVIPCIGGIIFDISWIICIIIDVIPFGITYIISAIFSVLCTMGIFISICVLFLGVIVQFCIMVSLATIAIVFPVMIACNFFFFFLAVLSEIIGALVCSTLVIFIILFPCIAFTLFIPAIIINLICVFILYEISLIPGIGEVVIPISCIIFTCAMVLVIATIAITLCVIVGEIFWFMFLIIEIVINLIGLLFALIPGCGFVPLCLFSSFTIGTIIWRCFDIVSVVIIITLIAIFAIFSGIFAIPYILCSVPTIEFGLMIFCSTMTATFLVVLPFLILCSPIMLIPCIGGIILDISWVICVIIAMIAFGIIYIGSAIMVILCLMGEIIAIIVALLGSAILFCILAFTANLLSILVTCCMVVCGCTLLGITGILAVIWGWTQFVLSFCVIGVCIAWPGFCCTLGLILACIIIGILVLPITCLIAPLYVACIFSLGLILGTFMAGLLPLMFGVPCTWTALAIGVIIFVCGVILIPISGIITLPAWSCCTIVQIPMLPCYIVLLIVNIPVCLGIVVAITCLIAFCIGADIIITLTIICCISFIYIVILLILSVVVVIALVGVYQYFIQPTTE